MHKKIQIKSRHSTSRNCKQEWIRMNEGFDGLDVTTVEQKRSATKLQSVTLLDKDKNDSESRSQVSINWESSDEEPTAAHKEQICGITEELYSNDRKVQSQINTKFSRHHTECSGQHVPIGHKGPRSATDTLYESSVRRKKNKQNNQNSSKLHGNSVINTGSIALYDSDCENSVAIVHHDCIQPDCENCQSTESQQTIISAEIDELSSPSVSGCNTNDQTKQKASDWASMIQQTLTYPINPSQECNEDENEDQLNVLDSAKKRKNKYEKDGLAERLQRLRTREKSSYTFWSHKISQKTSKDWSKILTVKVKEKQLKCSILECSCECMSLQPQYFGKSFTVLFTGQIVEKVQLSSVVNIHPPWQKLYLGNEKTVVLCTKFSELCVNDEGVTPQLEAQQEPNWFKVASWKCPCQLDPSVCSKDCPAEKVQVIKHENEHEENELKPELPPTQQNQFELEVIHLSQGYSQQTKPGGILTSIEKRTHNGQTVKFLATVQRIFCRRLLHNRLKEASSKVDYHVQYGMIVQDRKGVICEILLPDKCTDHKEWLQLVDNGEGKAYLFSGLKVVHRTNRAKHTALFTMIDSLWLPELYSQDSASQDSYNKNTSCNENSKQRPVFCYILKVVLGESHYTLNTTQPSLPHQPPTFCFTDVFPQKGRCSFNARVLHTWNESLDKTTITYVYHHKKFIIPLHHQATFPNTVEFDIDQIICVMDALNQNDRLVVDGYSIVKKSSASPQTYYSTMPVIPMLKNDSRLFDLVTVKGLVDSVDEESAYVWMVCNRCLSEKLTGGTAQNPFLFCNRCKKAVQEPITKMNLHIFASINQMDSVKIKIKLKQKTIQSLLPVKEFPDEGYDMNCVLGKQIGPICAVVTSKSKDTKNSSNVLVLEQITR